MRLGRTGMDPECSASRWTYCLQNQRSDDESTRTQRYRVFGPYDVAENAVRTFVHAELCIGIRQSKPVISELSSHGFDGHGDIQTSLVMTNFASVSGTFLFPAAECFEAESFRRR